MILKQFNRGKIGKKNANFHEKRIEMLSLKVKKSYIEKL